MGGAGWNEEAKEEEVEQGIRRVHHGGEAGNKRGLKNKSKRTCTIFSGMGPKLAAIG